MRRFMRALSLLAALALAVPLLADEASKLYKQGKEAELRQQYETAYDAFRKAWELKPGEIKYRTAMERLRFLAGSSHVHRGQLLRERGALPEALAEFQKAAELDASSFIAQQEIRRTTVMIEAARNAPASAPSPSPESKLSQRIQDAQGPVELAPISDQPITLKLSGDSRMIYESLGKIAGINVMFDPDYTARRVSIELNAVTLNQALNIVALESKTFWRPVTSNTIFIAADTATKRKELEQSVIKSFYLSNLSAASELQDVVNTLRQILEFSRVQQVPSQNMIIVRGTPDQVALAEKLINDMDKARPEVVVEVAMLAVRRDKLRQMGIRWPTSASVQLAGTTSTTTTTGGTTTTTTTPGTVSLAKLGSLTLSDFLVTIPSATATLLFTDDNTKVLENPQIRALDGQKASLKIGDRVPIATGSFQPGIGGVGINPLVNTQFQYIDVGVNIDITPRVHAAREVTLKLMLDISNVSGRVNIGGIDQPIIGQRKIEHEIRLKEGEVNLLGGIFEEQDLKSLAGLPGLGHIPFLRYFFSEEKKERIDTEIVFMLIPHIVRGQELSELNTRTLDVGTGAAIDLRRAARAESPKPAAPGGAAPTPAPAAATTEPGPSPETPKPAPGGPSALRFDPAEATQAVGSTFVVNVVYSGAQPIYAVPIQLSYDPKVLQLLNISNGGFLGGDGQSVALVHREDPLGTLQISATRPPGAGGISGEGPVFTLTFAAKSPGQSALVISMPGARDANMQVIQVTASPATVTVR